MPVRNAGDLGMRSPEYRLGDRVLESIQDEKQAE